MPRKRRLLIAASPEFDDDISERIRRLREMLKLMAPEPGSSALGATIPMYELTPRGARLMLPAPSPDTADL